jgi:hypothetical protein
MFTSIFKKILPPSSAKANSPDRRVDSTRQPLLTGSPDSSSIASQASHNGRVHGSRFFSTASILASVSGIVSTANQRKKKREQLHTQLDLIWETQHHVLSQSSDLKLKEAMPKLQADEKQLIETLYKEIEREITSNLKENSMRYPSMINNRSITPESTLGRLFEERMQLKKSVETEEGYKESLRINLLKTAATGKTPETPA